MTEDFKNGRIELILKDKNPFEFLGKYIFSYF
jgi:hypothetical protein